MSLIAHYKMNDDTASTVVEDSKGSNNGTLAGGDDTADISVAGKVNSALNLDGEADYISVDGLVAALADKTQGSVVFWAKIDEDDDDLNTVFSISRDADDTQSELKIQFDMLDGDYVQVWVTVDGADKYQVVTPENSLGAYVGEFVQIMVIHDGTTVSIYINNVVQELTWLGEADETKWWKSILTDATNKADTANIGVWEIDGDNEKFFDGALDVVSIYDHALSVVERNFLYNNGNGTEEEYSKAKGAFMTLNTKFWG